MLIAVNTRMLVKGKMEGIGIFTMESMKRIVKKQSSHRFLFLFDRPFEPEFIFADNVIPVVVRPAARHPFLWYLWYEWSLPPVFKKMKPNLFIGTDGYLSLSSGIQTLSVIHDLNFEHYPQDLPFFNRLYYRHYFPRYAVQAKRIAAVSEFTRGDIVKTYGVDASKIDVVYNGAGEHFHPVSDSVQVATRQKFAQGCPYFLFVGALHQRKNIANLLRAYDEFRKNSSSNTKLVLVGQKRWWTHEMESVHQRMKYKEDVLFAGRVSDEDLVNITASALALTYVSTFEGFGIPIVEAMRCGIPVLTSNVTSMPEIAGEAAMICDPFSVTSISDGLRALNSDEELRTNMIRKGLERHKNFTWEKTADSLWASVERTF